jgi:hypothetical protein
MKDFTKKELNILKAAMGEILFFPETPRLIEKIHTMIDNYCDHAQRQYYEHIPAYKCDDCKMVMMI